MSTWEVLRISFFSSLFFLVSWEAPRKELQRTEGCFMFTLKEPQCGAEAQRSIPKQTKLFVLALEGLGEWIRGRGTPRIMDCLGEPGTGLLFVFLFFCPQ